MALLRSAYAETSLSLWFQLSSSGLDARRVEEGGCSQWVASPAGERFLAAPRTSDSQLTILPGFTHGLLRELESLVNRDDSGIPDEDELIQRGLEGLEAIREIEAGSQRSFRATLRFRYVRFAVSTDGGPPVSDDGFHGQLILRAAGGQGEGFSSWTGAEPGIFDRESAMRAAMKSSEQAARLERAVVPPSGSSIVIFDPSAAGVLVHEVLGHSLEADTAAAGSALWASRGARWTSPEFSAFDDGRRSEAWERLRVDQEGTEVVKCDLVTEGRVVGTVSDRMTAARVGVSCSGNARRARYDQPFLPRVRHIVIPAGSADPAGIVADTSQGIRVKAVDNAEADAARGRFTIRVREAVEVVDGREGAPLTGFSLSGDLRNFETLDAVGRDQGYFSAMCGRGAQWIPVSGTSPTLRLGELTVRGC